MELDLGHWMPPNIQESYRDMISNLLFSSLDVTNFLAVKAKLTRILVNMDLGLLYVIKGKKMLI
jgi:hypothetical protein